MQQLERRPAVANARSILGAGIAPRSRLVIDWNNPDLLTNGWYSADAYSYNSPNPEFAWDGMVVFSRTGHGTMIAWSHDLVGTAPVEQWMRTIHKHNDGAATYGPWVGTGAASGTPSGIAGIAFPGSQMSNTTTVTFPVPFPIGTVPNVTATHVGGGGMSIGCYNVGRTGFMMQGWYSVSALNSTYPVAWHAML